MNLTSRAVDGVPARRFTLLSSIISLRLSVAARRIAILACFGLFATAGVLFAVVALAMLLAWGLTGLDASTAGVLIGVYALAGRIEFPVGAGYVVPTQLVLVPMLLILPPAAVPAAVGLGMVVGNAV